MTRGVVRGVTSAAKCLPQEARKYFIKSFKLTEESDVYGGDMELYMKDIYITLKDAIQHRQRRDVCVTKAIELLEQE